MPNPPTVSDQDRLTCEPYLGTAADRGKLMTSMFVPAQLALDFCQTKVGSGRMTQGVARSRVGRWLGLLRYVGTTLDGTERFDRTRYGSLVSDLQLFLASLVY